MPEPAARAYLRDLPEAELHLVEGAIGRSRPTSTRSSGSQDVFSGECMAKPKPQIARIWRGSTARSRADEKALGVQLFREDRADETEFVTISYWESVQAMSRFAGKDPTRIYHLERDAEFLLELPRDVQILAIVSASGAFGAR
jgi:hypothetical protein